MILSGDFSKESDFYKGDKVAVYSDEVCSQKVSTDLSYDFAPQTIKLNAKITLTEFKKYVFYIGILKGSSLVKCLDSGINHIKKVPVPTGFTLNHIDESYKADIRFQITKGITHVQLYSDEECSKEISDKQEVGKSITTNPLDFGRHEIYARFFADEAFSSCSSDSLSFKNLPAPTGLTLVETDKNNKAGIQLKNIMKGITHVQLYSGGECSKEISDKQEVGDVFTTNPLPFGSHEIHARFFSDKSPSPCSSESVSFESLLESVTSISLVLASATNPILEATGVKTGDKIQLFSDSSCSVSISDKKAATGTTVRITATSPIPNNHTIYAKRWDSQNNHSPCSSHIPYFIMNLSQIWSGFYHTCVVTASGNVKCWGRNDSGQLGDNEWTKKLNPVYVDASKGSSTHLSDIVQIETGFYHTCTLTTSGNVKCWGKNNSMQLGLGDNKNVPKNHPLDVVDGRNSTTLLSGVVQISAGGNHTCALTSSGNVKCWGYGGYGQLGDDGNFGSDFPTDVVAADGSDSSLANIVQVSTGGHHSCALDNSGDVKCWGRNNYGQLGNGNRNDKNHPETVMVRDENNNSIPLSGIVQIASGGAHTCALTMSGRVKCWGQGHFGEMGNGSFRRFNERPVSVASLTNAVQISAVKYHTCALTSSGNIKCWGLTGYGQLGNGVKNNTSKHRPVNVVEGENTKTPLSGIIQISSGGEHSCGLNSSGNIKCWGRNNYGQLGNGGSSYKVYPVSVVDDNDTPIQVGMRQVKFKCKGNSCSFDTPSLIALDLQTPGISPGTNSTPTIRVYHAKAEDTVSLHTNGDCSSESLASGTVAADSTSVDLTTSDLTDGQTYTIHAKVGDVCSSNSISYQYDSGSTE